MRHAFGRATISSPNRCKTFHSRRDHHEHTEYLIEHSSRSGFTPTERRLIASLARCHQGSVPRKKHRAYKCPPRARKPRRAFERRSRRETAL
jgi:exopolyphosphatase/pppGpp-phosphohydrolase